MHLHILGICGTFMAGVALIARQLGHRVSGCDANTYPPMSTLLESEGIEVLQGYAPQELPENLDIVVIGNAMTRGNPLVEHILNTRTPYCSGPEWLLEHVLQHRRVIAVAGTHGKTSTTSMICHMLDTVGIDCGFLVGGVTGNFNTSARLGTSPWFVIEADEYDTAFFDKRSKFVHYRPEVAILNNLEFDHADIFDDLKQIQRQFHHLIRTIPSNGTVVVNATDTNLAETLEMGCWSEIRNFGVTDADLCIGDHNADFSEFDIRLESQTHRVRWNQFGDYNALNACAALLGATRTGISLSQLADTLPTYQPPRRRQQQLPSPDGLTLYEDFAHHPTAITLTLNAIQARHPGRRIVLILEPRSNTMRMGIHNHELKGLMRSIKPGFLLSPPDWNPGGLNLGTGEDWLVTTSAEELTQAIYAAIEPGDVLVFMSNGGFQGVPAKISSELAEGAVKNWQLRTTR